MKNIQKNHPGVRGKIVHCIREQYNDDGFDIVVSFKDGTAMTWGVQSRAVLSPELTDWTSGNGKSLRRYPVLTTRR